MHDERLGRDLRAIDAPATPRPEFVEDLFAELEDARRRTAPARDRGPARRRRRPTNGPLLLAAALLIGGAVVGSALVAIGARTPTPSTRASLQAVALPTTPTPTTTAEAEVATTPRPQPSYLSFGAGTPGLSALEGDGLVVYERREIGKLTRLRALTPEGSSREFAPDVPGTQTGAAWAPDGTQLVFAAADVDAPAAWRIWRTHPDGTSPRLISTACDPPTCYGESEPAFSADGKRLAFVRTTAGPDGQPDGSVIAIRDLATGNVTELAATHRTGTDQLLHPTWSPDGKEIAFSVARRDANTVFLGSAIWLVGADGTQVHQLTADELLAGDPAWAPSGDRILFGSFPIRPTWAENQRDAGATHLYTMAADGTDVRQFPLKDAAGAAGWVAGGDQILFTDIVNAGDHGLGGTWLASMDAAGTTLRAVTRSNGCCSWYAVQRPTP